ncbi:hypothetical protein H0H92_004855 [Tricholoma furcatifolium]|nr:hypothetical protein H0H92_004855 [Tricholoma furcatifolium]
MPEIKNNFLGVILGLQMLRPWNSTKKGGVSAVAAMMHAMQFATGGYDHAVHLWDIKPDLSEAFERPLAIKHTSQVQSLLAIRDTSHKLLSAGADCNVHIWDLSSERVVNTLKPSNATYHLHATTSPFCTLLEVAHRELQFEVRDHRLIPQHPVLRFGYSTDKVHGRFIKGAATSEMFACGSRDGSIRLWDMRNTKSVATKTLAFKGFLVSTCTVVGMVFSAENALQAHEAEQRYIENDVRKQARYDLARRGIVATETEIAKWKRERGQQVVLE